MGVRNPEAGGVRPHLFMHLSFHPPPPHLPTIGWVDGGHVQQAETWLREDWDIYTACSPFILICLVCLTGEVTWLKVYELCPLRADSWLLCSGCWLQRVVLLFTGCKCVVVCVIVCAGERAYCADGIAP